MGAHEYFRTPEIMGQRPLKCVNCNNIMIRRFMSDCYEIFFECRKCKAVIYMKCKEAIPLAIQMKAEAEQIQREIEQEAIEKKMRVI